MSMGECQKPYPLGLPPPSREEDIDIFIEVDSSQLLNRYQMYVHAQQNITKNKFYLWSDGDVCSGRTE